MNCNLRGLLFYVGSISQPKFSPPNLAAIAQLFRHGFLESDTQRMNNWKFFEDLKDEGHGMLSSGPTPGSQRLVINLNSDRNRVLDYALDH